MEKLLEEFSLGLFFWQTILFVGLLILLKKYAWGPILRSWRPFWNHGPRRTSFDDLGADPNLRLQHPSCLSSRHLAGLSSRYLSCCSSRHLSCLNSRHLSCLNSTQLSCLNKKAGRLPAAGPQPFYLLLGQDRCLLLR